MKKYLLFFSIICFLTSHAMAYIPSPESLLRNGANQNITSNMITLKMKVNEFFEDTKQEKTIFFIKFIIYIENEDKIKLAQLTYDNQKMEENSLISLYYSSNYINSIKWKKELDLDKDIFFSFLFYSVLNQPSPIITFLKRKNDNFKSNEELVNTEKMELLKEYKNYLLEQKINPDLKDEKNSPLRSEDYQERVNIKNVLRQNIITPPNNIELIKRDRSFFWKISLNQTILEFTNTNHQLYKLIFDDQNNHFELICYNYLLFDGIHELPKHIVVKTSDKKTYSLETLSLSNSNTKISKYHNKIDQLKEIIKDKTPPLLDLIFLYR